VGATFQQIGDLDKQFYGGDAIEDDLDAIFSNPTPSSIAKWRTFKLLRWVQRNPLITFGVIGEF
jgi:hypothetical protein